MKILGLNGSPRGDHSITLQTVLYIRGLFPDDSFEILNVGQKIKAFERDFSVAAEMLRDAEVLLFAYPVYTFMVPSQLHRFIELIKEHTEIDLKGKWATQVSTSKHFYDTTAHKFIEQNCFDLGLKVVRGLSADMEDLLVEQGQKDAVAFWQYFRFCHAVNLYKVPQQFSTGLVPEFRLAIAERCCNADGGLPTATEDGFDTVIVADCDPRELASKVPASNLVRMIRRFQQIYPHPTRVVNLRDFHFNGGCLGCLKCAFVGKCVHKDGFDTFLREQIQTADATVYAFEIRDHSMGSLFKMYDDRQFCNGHRTVTMGSPVGYIISGALSAEENLRTIIEARADVGHNHLAYIVTDEQADGAVDTADASAGVFAADPSDTAAANGASDIDGAAACHCAATTAQNCTEVQLERLSRALDYALRSKLLLPQMFYGVGGRKIFRDLIYVMRGLMKEDHRFYKKHGFYDDLPSRQTKKLLTMKLLGLLVSNPKIAASGKIDEGMLAPYRKVLNHPQNSVTMNGTEKSTTKP